MDIGKKIGEGNYRETYAIKGTDLCLKKTKKYVSKTVFGRKLLFRSNIYNFLKFGVSDLNKLEYKSIKAMPAALNLYLPSNISFPKEGLIMERVKNMDGSYSTMLIDNGSVNNKVFWEHIETMIRIFRENKIFPSDILYRGNNIVIKKISDQEWIPIIVDFKRMNKGFDLFACFEFGNKKTFNRRLARFEKMYKPV